jgi:hypothetical protein
MKQFFRSIALFIPFAAAVYVLCVIVTGNFEAGLHRKNLSYRKGSIGYLYSRLHEIPRSADVDILFLGSSHCYRGFDTRIFSQHGLRTLNLGSSAQSVLQTEVLLKRYLGTIKPKMIIWEVSPASLMSDGVESSLDVVSNDTNDVLSVMMALRQNHITVYNTLLYAIYLDVFHQNASFTETRRKADDIYIDGGFVEKDPQQYQIIRRGASDVVLNATQFAAFEECIALIRQRGCRLLMVQAPIASTLYASYLHHDEFDSMIGSYGAYLNFNTILALRDSTDFYDSDHLNHSGVRAFNDTLIAMLSAAR